MDLSDGRLFQFKRRNHFKPYRCHGEQGGADEEGMQCELPVLFRRLSSFNVNEVFSADEFDFFYRQLSSTSIAPSLRERKKRKDRVKFLACSDGDGTERLPPLVIEYSRRPRCF